jgi:uroporphyrinogen-III synthase
MDQPLAGRRLLLPPSRTAADIPGRRLAQRGARVLRFPRLEIAGAADPAPLDAGLDQLRAGDWIVASGAPSAEALLDRCPQPPAGVRCGVIGQAALGVMRRAGWRVEAAPVLHTPEGIADDLEPLSDRRVLLVREAHASDRLPGALEQAGAEVLTADGYRLEVRAERDDARAALSPPPDALVLANPTAVAVFVEGLAALGLSARRCLALVPVLAIGPETADAARAEGLVPDLVSGGRLNPLLADVVALMGRGEDAAPQEA